MTSFQSKVIRFVAMLTLATGPSCRTTEQYAGYAQAGSAYASAMDKLLVATTQTSIDKHSEQLLTARGTAATAPPLFGSDLTKLNAEDTAMVALISRLRTHTQLLGSYFGKLNDLATSKDPTAMATSAEGLATAINGLGDKLRGQSLVSIPVSPITNLVVSAKIRGALNRELTARQSLIRREIRTQQDLFKALSDKIKQDVAVINNAQFDRLVNKPISGPVLSDGDKWIRNRQTILTRSLVVDQLTDAGRAANKLQEAFEELIRGGDTRTKINSVLTDVQTLTSVTESLTKKS
jgi:hypothetical protein